MTGNEVLKRHLGFAATEAVLRSIQLDPNAGHWGILMTFNRSALASAILHCEIGDDNYAIELLEEMAAGAQRLANSVIANAHPSQVYIPKIIDLIHRNCHDMEERCEVKELCGFHDYLVDGLIIYTQHLISQDMSDFLDLINGTVSDKNIH